MHLVHHIQIDLTTIVRLDLHLHQKINHLLYLYCSSFDYQELNIILGFKFNLHQRKFSLVAITKFIVN